MSRYLPFVLVFVLGAGCAFESSVDVTTPETENITIEGESEVSLEGDTISEQAIEAQDNREPVAEAEKPAEIESAPNGNSDDPVNPKLVTLKSGNFFFEPDTIFAKYGQTVTINFSENSGFHTFVIDELNLKQTVSTSGTVTFVAPTTPGRYEFYCDVGSHRDLGMKGTLIVE